MSCPANCDKPKCPSRVREWAISDKPIVWVLGGPGAGKGTQCAKIVEKYGFTHLSTGDLLRDEIKTGSERAKKIAALIKEGALVPNEIVLDLLKEALQKKAGTSKGFLIDGYPREETQGVAFERAIAPASAIIYFETTNETMTKRLLDRGKTSGRADDNEEAIKQRLRTFQDNNDKVISQYSNKVHRINAERDVDVVFSDVQSFLDRIVKK